MESYTTDEPIYALATVYAPSALAVIRTSGRGALALLSPYFSRPKALSGAKSGTTIHGFIRDEEGVDVDEVVLSVFLNGHGYTGEESVEISAHGSPAGLKRLMRVLETAGFRAAKRGEFTFRAFMHGKLDLTQAEAVEELISAGGASAQEKALERLEGRLRDKLEVVRETLLEILASLEVQLDYGEDEIIEDWVFPVEKVDEILVTLKRLVSTFSVSRLYSAGAKVVLAGAVNAGKSSLFNLLAKEERAIVSSTPGTTRDYIEVKVEIRGIPVRLYDTAGLREGEDIIESEGIRRSEELMKDADLVVYLEDPERPIPVDETLDNLLIVSSKKDLKDNPSMISFSSLTGEGIDRLLDAIADRLEKGKAGENDEVFIDSERQRDDLLLCIETLEEAKKAEGESVDILALLFSSALSAIGRITGEVTSEELLDTLFSKFCVGK